MRILLDSHTLVWAVDHPSKLGSHAVAALRDPNNELLLSAGTIWELAIKVGLNKLSLSMPFRPWVSKAAGDLSATILPILVDHADEQLSLPKHHGDPFDRLLIAQAQVENLTIVSGDAVFDRYGAKRVW